MRSTHYKKNNVFDQCIRYIYSSTSSSQLLRIDFLRSNLIFMTSLL